MAFDYVNAIIRLGPCGSAERWLNENRGATAQQLWDKCPDWCWMTWLCDIVAWRIRSESFGATDHVNPCRRALVYDNVPRPMTAARMRGHVPKVPAYVVDYLTSQPPMEGLPVPRRF